MATESSDCFAGLLVIIITTELNYGVEDYGTVLGKSMGFSRTIGVCDGRLRYVATFFS
jgi:hypothetical protein